MFNLFRLSFFDNDESNVQCDDHSNDKLDNNIKNKKNIDDNIIVTEHNEYVILENKSINDNISTKNKNKKIKIKIKK